MRHGKKFNHLGRKAGHRKALLKNLAISLIKHKRITTTLAKAKALRQYVEPLVTKSKLDTMASRRTVFSYLQDNDSVKELFGNISEKVATRNGGYTRIIKLGTRLGDNADLAMIELVDFNELYTQGKDAGSTKKRTRRRKKSSSTQNSSEQTDSVSNNTVEESNDESKND